MFQIVFFKSSLLFIVDQIKKEEWNDDELLNNVPSMSNGFFYVENQNTLKRSISDEDLPSESDFAIENDEPEKEIAKKKPVFNCTDCKRTFCKYQNLFTLCFCISNYFSY